MNSIINRLGLENLPAVTYLNLPELITDGALHDSIRMFAIAIQDKQYSTAGFYLFLLESSSEGLEEMLAIAKLASNQVDDLKAGTNIMDLPELYNIVTLTYLMGLAEGLVSLDEIDLNNAIHTAGMLQLLKLQRDGKGTVNTKNLTAFPNALTKPFFTKSKGSQGDDPEVQEQG